MAGRRRPALGVERLATGIRSGSASPFTAGGLVQASPITGLDRTDARRRDLIPAPPTAPVAGGLYVPAFSVPGEQVQDYYQTRLHNITGAGLTLVRLTAALGTPATGDDFQVSVWLDNDAPVGFVSIADGASFGQTVLAASWPAASFLEVEVGQVGSDYPGKDLVVQVLTA